MPTVLITGANRGLGLEFARQYVEDGWQVIACCRQPEQAHELAQIRGEVDIRRLDVADDAQRCHLVESLEGTQVNVLINNAGLYGPRSQPLGGLDFDAWRRVMEANVYAPVRMAELMVERMSVADQPRIVALSSKMGSIADNSSGGLYIYRSSKTALNMAYRSLALDLAGRGIAVAVLHPGWVRTDMGGPNGLIDPPESVAGMRAVIDRLTPELAGRFYNYDGSEIPW